MLPTVALEPYAEGANTLAGSVTVSTSVAGPAVETRPDAQATAVEKADTDAGPCAGPASEACT